MARFVYRLQTLWEQKEELKKGRRDGFWRAPERAARRASRLEELVSAEKQRAQQKKRDFRAALLVGTGEGYADCQPRGSAAIPGASGIRCAGTMSSPSGSRWKSARLAWETARQEMSERSRELEC